MNFQCEALYCGRAQGHANAHSIPLALRKNLDRVRGIVCRSLGNVEGCQCSLLWRL